MKTRTFEDSPAVRSATPVWVGLVGPSGSGKTFSALRLATGMQRVSGGEIFFVDTESRRALHYADRFKFRHVPFIAPFAPADYMAAFEHCVSKGARTIIVDSFSHVWEGAGGVLEMHDAAVERMSQGDSAKAERVKMAAWIEPKAEHRRMINRMLQMPVNFIACLRGKEKLAIVRGGNPKERGVQPIGSDELVYELTLKCLLMPGSDGVPTWTSDIPDERALIKLPLQFRKTFTGEPRQLSEDIGEALARWAAGDAPQTPAQPSGVEPRVAPSGGDSGRFTDIVRKVTEGLDATDADGTFAAWLEAHRPAIREMAGKNKAEMWKAIVAHCNKIGADVEWAGRFLSEKAA